MPVVEVRGLEKLVATLRELASGKYLDGVVRASRARLMRRLDEAPPASSANRLKPAAGRWTRPSTALPSDMEKAKHSPYLVRSNRAAYAQLAMGVNRERAAMHRRLGRTSVDEILEEEVPRVEADLVAAVEEVLEG